MVLMAGDCPGQEYGLCFAFIRRADVFVTCEGQTTRITHRADLTGFAVSDEQTSLVYRTWHLLKDHGIWSESETIATVINLQTGGRREVRGAGGVASTCGGIFSIDVASPALDLLHGGQLSYPFYSLFRCSSDGKIVVGYAKDFDKDLYEGVPPAVRITSFKAAASGMFDISPDGSRVAYLHSPDSPLCVFSPPGPAQCANDRSAMADPPSVNNAGEVLATVGTGQGCYYKSSWYFSDTPLPGRRISDVCLAIGYWRAGLDEIQIVEPLARKPQWIAPATARLLREWSARSGGDAPGGAPE